MYDNNPVLMTCAILFQEKSGLKVRADDTLISYLPLAHSYERLCEVRLFTLALAETHRSIFF